MIMNVFKSSTETRKSMNSSKLKHSIQRVNLFRMIFPLLFLVLLLMIATQFPLINCLFPTNIDSSKSATELYNSKSIYVKTTTGKLYYTGYDYLKGSSVKGHYFYSLVNGKCTIYLFSSTYFKDGVPSSIENVEIKAMLIHNRSNLEHLLTLMAKDMNWTYDGLASCTDTIIVSQMNYAVIPSVLIGIFIFFAFSFSLGHILILLFNMCMPQYSFTFVTLGHHMARKKIIIDAAHELDNKVYFKSENMHITKNYFIYTSKFNIAVIPLANMAWAYKYSRLHKYFIFGEMNYTIKIYTKNKFQYTFSGKTKESADNFLAYLEDQNENMLIGYTYENRLHAKDIMHSILSILFR